MLVKRFSTSNDTIDMPEVLNLVVSLTNENIPRAQKSCADPAGYIGILLQCK